MPLLHLDRERSTGWSHIPVEISRVLEDGPEGFRCWSEEGRLRDSPEKGWEEHPLLASPLRPSQGIKPGLSPFSQGIVLLLPFEMAERWEPSGGPFRGPAVSAYVIECREVVSWHAPTSRLFVPKGFDRSLLEPVTFPEQSPVILVPDLGCEGFSSLFDPVKEGLERGDYFQVNIALRFLAEIPGRFDPIASYARILKRFRSRYGGFFSFGNRFLLSHSPEQLLFASGDLIRTRPIAGTLASGASETLFSDPKLLAEHIMTVDLLRNDLGRVCRPGTVDVPTLLSIETYPHLRHLVSEVRGTADSRHSRAAVIQSLFPGGSVTGAPRIRVRREIGRLENTPRNYYCGTLGFVSETGEMDMALLIRTLEGERTDEGGRLIFGAGAGIVADSRREEEYGEIVLKARVLEEMLS